MEINQNRIKEMLELYKPEARVLINGQVEYPVLRGEFKIQPTFYTTSHLEHVADIEIQLCLNQLVYAGLSQAIEGKVLPELNGLNFQELQREGCLIIESRKKFRRPIKTDFPIRGDIIINDFGIHQNLILGHAKFDFENRSCIGDLTLALIKKSTLA
ncbi:MAG: FcoT family thioesterase [Nanoarchaeota archaeon]